MNQAKEYLQIDSANIPLACEPEDDRSLFGQFIDNQPEEVVSLLGPFESRDLFLPNFTVRTFEGIIPRDAMFYDQTGAGIDMVGSCIFLKGRIKTFLPGTRHEIVSYNGSQNFKFDPANELRHHCKADTELNFIHVSLKPDFLTELLPENELWADSLRAMIERRERIIGDQFASVSLAQEKALANLFTTPLTGKLGYMMMETSLIQVLLLQLHSLFQKNESERTPAIQKRDLEVINDLRGFLSEKFLEDHTLMGLARQFGTNTNKLMNLFRKVFGVSIFEYISGQRMDHAQRLLREGLLVNEVSRNVGYKNPNHFSAAFKKHFGVNPSMVKG